MKKKLWTMGSLIAAVLLSAGIARADVIIADVRANYAAGTGNSTTAAFNGGLGLSSTVPGTGYWNYMRYDGVMYEWGTSQATALAYGDTSGNRWGTVTDQPIWDGLNPASNEVAWHADDVASTIIRWTAGASFVTQQVKIVGADRAIFSTGFAILLNGTPVVGLTTVGNTGFSFNETVSVSAGDYIDFIKSSTGSISGGASGNASALSAQLSVIPEPATFSMLGVAALAMLMRRRLHG
jgi:hypothetical protein